MPYTVDSFWTSKLAAIPSVSHCYYKVTDIPHIPDVPGLYSWHLWIDSTNTDRYSQVFKHKRAKIDIQSNLSEQFQGFVQHVGHDKDIFDTTTDLNICNVASIAMCPPLYIGISTKLRTRLSQHVDELDKIIKGIKPTPVSTVLKSQFDTIWESQHFAQRMGYVIKKLNNRNANNLLIKTIEMPVGYAKKDLQTIETFLNRTYIPIYGRR